MGQIGVQREQNTVEVCASVDRTPIKMPDLPYSTILIPFVDICETVAI